MAASLLTHPTVAAAMWRAWFEAGLQPARRDFQLSEVMVERRARPLSWRRWTLSPFAELSLVQRADATPERVVLLAPPITGAFPFILRDVAAALATSARVAILEWSNAHYVPGSAGPFRLDDQTDLIMRALRRFEPRPHLIALCQAGTPSLTAAALTARKDAGPLSLTLIASPILPSAAVSPFSRRISRASRALYEAAMIWRETAYGDLRRVFPSEAHFPALSATLASQDPDRVEFARMIRESLGEPGVRFLDMVTSFMDTPAEFVIDNLTRLYLTPKTPCAATVHRGASVDFTSLEDTPMAVVEGGQDHISAPGQTRAAFDLAPSVSAPREALLLPGAGHFGLFVGATWRDEVWPFIDALMADAERRAAIDRLAPPWPGDHARP